jgi:hypothetical protein
MFTREVLVAVVSNHGRTAVFHRDKASSTVVEVSNAIMVDGVTSARELWNSPLGNLLGVTLLALQSFGIDIRDSEPIDEDEVAEEVEIRGSEGTVRRGQAKQTGLLGLPRQPTRSGTVSCRVFSDPEYTQQFGFAPQTRGHSVGGPPSPPSWQSDPNSPERILKAIPPSLEETMLLSPPVSPDISERMPHEVG